MHNTSGTLLKVCGMGSAKKLQQIDQLGVDFLGFIFHEKSPRHLQNEDLLSIPTKAKKVLVTRDMAVEKLVELAQRNKIKWLQLHGNESIEDCIEYKKHDFMLIKNMAISQASDFKNAIDFMEITDFLLFDTASPKGGGTGQRFDWSWLNNYRETTKFFLSGGIAPDDAKAISELKHPALAGIDLNSRFETKPGHKNIILLKHFIDELQHNKKI